VRYKKEKCSGFLLSEMIVGLTVLGVLLAGLAVSLNGFARFNKYQLLRQRCTAAAQAELDSIAATGTPISDEDFKRLWPKVEVVISKSQGTGHWTGFTLVQVTTINKSFKRPVRVKLCRYIIPGEGGR